jgi:hypothetical protein
MTAFCSHQDRLHELAGAAPSSRQSLRAQLRRFIDRTIAAFGSRGDLFLEPTSHRSRDPRSDAARFPQRPMILGDKWDF